MAPWILNFSIAMGANYSFYVKTIETHLHAFLALNILAIDRVICATRLKKLHDRELSTLYFKVLEIWICCIGLDMC